MKFATFLTCMFAAMAFAVLPASANDGTAESDTLKNVKTGYQVPGPSGEGKSLDRVPTGIDVPGCAENVCPENQTKPAYLKRLWSVHPDKIVAGE